MSTNKSDKSKYKHVDDLMNSMNDLKTHALKRMDDLAKITNQIEDPNLRAHANKLNNQLKKDFLTNPDKLNDVINQYVTMNNNLKKDK